ncbi:hypothetical protein DSL92_01180 [Billgrantia gudaonensis]|uniref:Uncharacterized protein n=1 Tax=Billgrantia gudaonensis TaxID=376427 RepID=A0A432JM51_9GAMM|nr:hypothetical protein DSL92_01180 [Halomonas gudaonensis]
MRHRRGRVLQLTNVSNPTSAEPPTETIQGKTAMLLSGLAQRRHPRRCREQEAALQHYGRYLGLRLPARRRPARLPRQRRAMGKNVGDDLAEGKPTLPLIQAMAPAPEQAS